MIAERCAPTREGVKLNAPCQTCGHTMAAHTSGYCCDICDVLLTVLAFLRAQR